MRREQREHWWDFLLNYLNHSLRLWRQRRRWKFWEQPPHFNGHVSFCMLLSFLAEVFSQFSCFTIRLGTKTKQLLKRERVRNKIQRFLNNSVEMLNMEWLKIPCTAWESGSIALSSRILPRTHLDPHQVTCLKTGRRGGSKRIGNESASNEWERWEARRVDLKKFTSGLNTLAARCWSQISNCRRDKHGHVPY